MASLRTFRSSGRIGQYSNRDPYPWDGSKTLSRSTNWRCCEMDLPATFYICPICENERCMNEDEPEGYWIDLD